MPGQLPSPWGQLGKCIGTVRFVGKKNNSNVLGMMPLSLKFQSKENTITTNLLFWITTLQFIAVFLSQIGALYIRVYHSTNKLTMAFKENMDLFNYYTLVLPVLSTVYLMKAKRRRIKDIKDNVNIKTIGKDGWINYSSVIQKQWK
ncbi:unnamed protein product [Haemonchus placei]|uniref:Serpentine receptor class gamma n=1 Tax=Haemonchus placei TaxID=6290 RepID=A0A0N4W6R0_HAEPC|nr:unnamed protein product [Haemonchus placei]